MVFQNPTGPQFNLFISGNIDFREIMRIAKSFLQLFDGLTRPATTQHLMSKPDEFIHHRPAKSPSDTGYQDDSAARHGADSVFQNCRASM